MPAAAMKKSPVTIELHEDYAKLIFDNNGVKTEKVGEVSAVIDIFKSIESSFVLPRFPFGCARVFRKGSTVFTLTYHEEGVIKDFKYYDQVLTVPVPKTLLLCTLTDIGNDRYKFVHCSFFPVKETYLNNDNIQIYSWPFPNQSPEYRGKVCWGNDPTIQMFRNGCSLFDMGAIYNLFFAARGNDDYGWRINNPRTEEDTRDRIPAIMKNKTVFPYDQLVPCSKTVAQLIKDCLDQTSATAPTTFYN